MKIVLVASVLTGLVAGIVRADPISGEPVDVRVAPLIKAKWAQGNLLLHLNMGFANAESGWYYPPTNNPRWNGKFIYDNARKGTYLNPVVYNISPTMRPGTSIVSGRVLSGEKAAEGVDVVALDASGRSVATAVSNAKGIYALVLPAGRYTLRASNSDKAQVAQVSVAVVATAGAVRSDAGAKDVIIGNRHGVDIALPRFDRGGNAL